MYENKGFLKPCVAHFPHSWAACSSAVPPGDSVLYTILFPPINHIKYRLIFGGRVGLMPQTKGVQTTACGPTAAYQLILSGPRLVSENMFLRVLPLTTASNKLTVQLFCLSCNGNTSAQPVVRSHAKLVVKEGPQSKKKNQFNVVQHNFFIQFVYFFCLFFLNKVPQMTKQLTPGSFNII